MKTLNCMVLAAILLAHPGAGVAAERGGRGEERAIRQTLAQYPAEIREAVCAVAMHPELLVRLARAQQESSAEFAELLERQPERLACTSDLVCDLAYGGIHDWRLP